MPTLTVFPSEIIASLSRYSEAKYPEKSYQGAQDVGGGATLNWGEYAVFYSAAGSTSKHASVTYSFNLSALPTNAIIKNVTCTVTASHYNGEYSYNATNTVSLGVINGTSFTPQVSGAPAISGSYFTNLTLSGGSWTRASLQNCGLRLVTAKSYVADEDLQFHVSFAGATLTVDYIVLGYANVNGVWKKNTNGYVNIGGTWKKISEAYANVDGVWKSIG